MINTKHKQLQALRLTDPLYGLMGGKDKGGVGAPLDPYACPTHPFRWTDTLENDDVRACPACMRKALKEKLIETVDEANARAGEADKIAENDEPPPPKIAVSFG